MNKQKKLLVMLAALVLVSAVTVVVVRREETKENIKNTPATILEWSDITAVSWTYEEQSYAFEKNDDTWVYPEDTAFPVDQEKMEELLSQFEDLGAAFTIEDVEDYGQYGLEKPSCTITLTQGEETRTLELGDYSKMDAQRYASLGDGNVYLLSHDPIEEFDTDLSGLIQQDQVPELLNVETITLTGDQTDQFRKTQGQSLCQEDEYFRDSDGSPLDTDLTENYLYTLENVSLTDYVTYKATEEDLQNCYLDTPAQTVTVTYKPEEEEDTATFTLHLGKAPDKSEEEPGQAYARVGDSPILYKISESQYEALTACGYGDLRHQNLFTGDFSLAKELTVTLEGSTRVFTYEEQDQEEPAWYLGEEQVDLTDIQTALENLTVETFTTEAPAGKEELSLTVTLDQEGENTLTLTFYRQDGTTVLAQANGKTLCTLPRAQVVTLTESFNAILLG